MKVKDLIEKLKKFNEDDWVYAQTEDYLSLVIDIVKDENNSITLILE